MQMRLRDHLLFAQMHWAACSVRNKPTREQKGAVILSNKEIKPGTEYLYRKERIKEAYRRCTVRPIDKQQSGLRQIAGGHIAGAFAAPKRSRIVT